MVGFRKSLPSYSFLIWHIWDKNQSRFWIRWYPESGVVALTSFPVLHYSADYIWAAARQNQQNDKCTQRDQPGHPSSLNRVFNVGFMGSQGPNASSCGQRRLWSDGTEAQADPSLRWAHRLFCWFYRAAAHLYFLVLWDRWVHLQSSELYNTAERSARGCDQCCSYRRKIG